MPRRRRDQRRRLRVLHGPPVPRQRHHHRDARHQPARRGPPPRHPDQVVDAAGNATVVAERTVGVDNQPPAAGVLRSRDEALPESAVRHRRRATASTASARHPTRDCASTCRSGTPCASSTGRTRASGAASRGPPPKRTVSFSSRATLRARLSSAAGQPISGAKVWTATRAEGSDWQITGQPQTTSKTGSVGFRLPASGPSREINLVYFPFSDSHEQAVGRPIKLNVRCGVRLSVDRQTFAMASACASRVGWRAGAAARRDREPSSQARAPVPHLPPSPHAPQPRTAASARPTGSPRPPAHPLPLPPAVLKQAGLPYERGSSPTRTVTVTP